MENYKEKQERLLHELENNHLDNGIQTLNQMFAQIKEIKENFDMGLTYPDTTMDLIKDCIPIYERQMKITSFNK